MAAFRGKKQICKTPSHRLCDAPAPRRLFGRRRGRKLSAARQALLRRHLPAWQLSQAQLPQIAASFAFAPQELALEIGFGGGEHLAARAAAAPRCGFLGVDVYETGIASLMAQGKAAGLQNIRLFLDDVRVALPLLPRAAWHKIYVLYPDPWPKARHHKRRLIKPDFLTLLHALLAPQGELQFASDDADYAGWTLVHLRDHGGFSWRAERAGDWTSPPPGWPGTRYERKARARKRHPVYLRLTKRARPRPGCL